MCARSDGLRSSAQVRRWRSAVLGGGGSSGTDLGAKTCDLNWTPCGGPGRHVSARRCAARGGSRNSSGDPKRLAGGEGRGRRTQGGGGGGDALGGPLNADRKSTRLNSSHLGISYAVFC